MAAVRDHRRYLDLGAGTRTGNTKNTKRSIRVLTRAARAIQSRLAEDSRFARCGECGRVFARTVNACPHCREQTALEHGPTVEQQRTADEFTRTFEAYLQANEDLVSFGASEFNAMTGAYDEEPAVRLPSCDVANLSKIMGWLQQALAEYEAVLSQTPGDERASAGRASVLHHLGRPQEALAECDAALRRNPAHEEAGCRRAHVLHGASHLSEALQGYEQVLLLNPRSEEAELGRCRVLGALGHYDEALAGYDIVCAKFPRCDEARCDKARLLLTLGRFDEALAQIPSGPGLAYHHYFARALVLLKMGEVYVAERCFADGLRSPFPAEVTFFRTGLALVALRRGNVAGALVLLEQVKLSSLLPLANLLRAHALDVWGEPGPAAEALYGASSQEAPVFSEVREELRRRIYDEPLAYDEAGVFAREVDLLAQAPHTPW